MKGKKEQELKDSLVAATKKTETLLNQNRQIKNTDLIKICRECGIELISNDNETHLIHEILETAINQSIAKTFQREHLTTRNSQFQRLNGLKNLLKNCPTQTWRGEEQIKFQQFGTPPTIAFLMAKILLPSETDMILEPSAGTGSLAVWLKAAGCRTHLNELSATRRMLLKLQGYESTGINAEFLDDLLPKEFIPDGVLMNPPFSANAGRTKSGDSNFGFRHVKSALARLKDGGKLVALLGSETLTKTGRGIKFISEIASENELKAIINLPKDAFYKYGTTYPTTIICVTKNKPKIKLTRSLTDILRIDCQTLEDVLEILDLFD